MRFFVPVFIMSSLLASVALVHAEGLDGPVYKPGPRHAVLSFKGTAGGYVFEKLHEGRISASGTSYVDGAGYRLSTDIARKVVLLVGELKALLASFPRENRQDAVPAMQEIAIKLYDLMGTELRSPDQIELEVGFNKVPGFRRIWLHQFYIESLREIVSQIGKTRAIQSCHAFFAEMSSQRAFWKVLRELRGKQKQRANLKRLSEEVEVRAEKYGLKKK